MYEVELTSRARREFDKLPLSDKEHIEAVLERLSANPRQVGTRKLFGVIYRARAGDWRVIFAIIDRNHRIVVLRIARRSENTYDGVRDLF